MKSTPFVWILVFFGALTCHAIGNAAGEVEKVCGSLGTKVLVLEPRDRNTNVFRIRNSALGKTKYSKLISGVYLPRPLTADEELLQETADKINGGFIPPNSIKARAIKFSSKKRKLEDPVGYRNALIDSFGEVVPAELNRLSWFLNLKDPIIDRVELRPAKGRETGEIYGAVANFVDSEKGKYKLEIVFSNENSEALPYLIPLLAHELKHAENFKARIASYKDERKSVEFAIIDEAIGNDFQMQVYIALAKKMPELFCNWTYVSWKYGLIVVPLSWTMASLENEMRAGELLISYAKDYERQGRPSVLNADKSDLREDIKDKIKALKLKYVR